MYDLSPVREQNRRGPFQLAQPNNHVLHTLGVKLSTLVWGSHPLSIRIPAFLAALVSIALVYRVAREMDGSSGLLSALATAVFPYLVLFGSIARGYSLLIALMLALVLMGSGYLRNPTRGKILPFAAVSALGLWTIPSMLFAIAGLFVWIAAVLLIEKRGLANLFRRFLIPCASLTMAFTFILYTPVIIASNGIRMILRNRYVTPQPFAEFLRDIPDHLKKTEETFPGIFPWPPSLWASFWFSWVSIFLFEKAMGGGPSVALHAFRLLDRLLSGP